MLYGIQNFYAFMIMYVFLLGIRLGGSLELPRFFFVSFFSVSCLTRASWKTKRLIFMTYNGWIMIAVSVGAGLGYLVFGGRTPATKETACH